MPANQQQQNWLKINEKKKNPTENKILLSHTDWTEQMSNNVLAFVFNFFNEILLSPSSLNSIYFPPCLLVLCIVLLLASDVRA